MNQLPPGVEFEEDYRTETDVDTWQVTGAFKVWGTWRVVVILDPADRWTVTRLTVEPLGEVPVGGLTKRELRQLPLEAMQYAARRDAAEGARYFAQPSPDRAIKASPGMAELLLSFADEVEGKRRPRIPELLLAEYAEVYVEARSTRRPLEVLAEQKGVSISEATNRIRQARQRGLLTPTSRGKQGGKLTERANQLLGKV